MARKTQNFTDDQKAVALAFLERMRGDFAGAAKKAKVPEAALRVWFADELTGRKNLWEEDPEPDYKSRPSGPLLVAPPFLDSDPSTFLRASINRSLRETEIDGQPFNRLLRPYPPEHLMRPERWPSLFEPALDAMDWIRAAYVEEGAPLYDDEQWHLGLTNMIGVLWTNVPYFRQGTPVWGTAEIPLKQTKSVWAKAKEAQQLMNWFGGEIPDFLLTLDAVYCGEAGDREWCSGVDHELRHCFYKTDEFGQMKMNGDKESGIETPSWATRGHCVEEHVRIAELYGAEACAGRTVDFHAALNKRPKYTDADIARACGRCS